MKKKILRVSFVGLLTGLISIGGYIEMDSLDLKENSIITSASILAQTPEEKARI